MEWWEWIFGGVGGAAAVALAGYLLRRRSVSEDRTVSQTLIAGNDSQNIQAAGDVSDARGPKRVEQTDD